MAIDFKIDENDEMVVVDGDFVLVYDLEEIIQSIRIRLRFILGEWKFNFLQGVDWLGSMFTPATSLEQKEQILKETILGTEGVTGLLSFSFEVDPINRGALVRYGVSTIYGDTGDQVVEIST